MGVIVNFCSDKNRRNTGRIGCDVQLGAFVFMFVGGAVITPEEYATEETLKAALMDRIHRANGDPQKLYPWSTKLAQDIAKTKESDTVETAADGQKRVLRVAPESYDLTHWNVGLNQESAMTTFNNDILPAFCFDKNFKAVGRFDSDKNWVGTDVLLNTSGQGFATYQNGPATKTSVSFIDPYALNLNARVFQFGDFDFALFEGLLDATLRTVIAPTGNTHKIGAFMESLVINQEQDLYPIYDDELASTSLWIGTKTSDGTDLAPTTVVKDATNKCWTIAFSAAINKIRLAAPPELYSAGVKGLEGVELAI